MTAKQSGLRGKVRDGTVVSDKMQKTVVVAVEANFRHRLYKKTVRRVRRLMAHDEAEVAHLGDRVRIIEAAPISRRKRWRLLEVLTRADLPEVAPESIDLELLGEVKSEEPEIEEAAKPRDGAKAKSKETVPAEAIAGPDAEARREPALLFRWDEARRPAGLRAAHTRRSGSSKSTDSGYFRSRSRSSRVARRCAARNRGGVVLPT